MKKVKSFLTTIILMLTIFLIILNPSSKDGAKNGIHLCVNVVIPALLPILVITNIIVKTKCSLVLEKIFGKFTLNVLRLPRCSTSAIILGLIGGYPSAAILTEHLYITNQISSNQAKRIMRFCFCGGVAFIVTGVGTITLKSTFLGILIYIINISVSITIAIISSLFYPKIYVEKEANYNYLGIQQSLIESVEIAIKSLLNMSTYIILFSSLISVFSIPSLILPLFEITNGICNNKNISFNYICAYICFGGFCIHFQLIGILNNIKMKYSDFLLWRVISSILCFIISSIYLKLFPQAVDVFCNIDSSIPKLNQVNASLSIIMIISSAVLILDLDEKKKYHLPN